MTASKMAESLGKYCEVTHADVEGGSGWIVAVNDDEYIFDWGMGGDIATVIFCEEVPVPNWAKDKPMADSCAKCSRCSHIRRAHEFCESHIMENGVRVGGIECTGCALDGVPEPCRGFVDSMAEEIA